VPAAKVVGQRTTASTATCADAVELRMTRYRTVSPRTVSLLSVLQRRRRLYPTETGDRLEAA